METLKKLLRNLAEKLALMPGNTRMQARPVRIRNKNYPEPYHIINLKCRE